MTNVLEENVVTDTVSELADPDALSRDHLVRRLRDWQRRVHALYDDIEGALPAEFVIDRSGKQRSNEELVQRAHLGEEDVPSVDILRIEDADGRLRASMTPRSLWIVGANGSLDLWLFRDLGRRSVYQILDMSRVLIPPSRWRVAPFADPTDERPFSGQVLVSMLMA